MGDFELNNDRTSILCLTHNFSISPHSRIYVLFNQWEREGSIFIKAETWILLSISLPEGVRETPAQSETHVKNSTRVPVAG